jgi:hypothetical protein
MGLAASPLPPPPLVATVVQKVSLNSIRLYIQPWRIGQFRHNLFKGIDPPEIVDRNPEAIVRRKWEGHEQ